MGRGSDEKAHGVRVEELESSHVSAGEGQALEEDLGVLGELQGEQRQEEEQLVEVDERPEWLHRGLPGWLTEPHLQAELGEGGAHQHEQSAVVHGTATLLERGLHLRSQVLELGEGQRESEQGGHAQGGQLGGHSACSLEGERQDLSEE